MPRVKIVDGDRSIEIDDDNANITHLFVLATDCMDHRTENKLWLPNAYREQMAAKDACPPMPNNQRPTR